MRQATSDHLFRFGHWMAGTAGIYRLRKIRRGLYFVANRLDRETV